MHTQLNGIRVLMLSEMSSPSAVATQKNCTSLEKPKREKWKLPDDCRIYFLPAITYSFRKLHHTFADQMDTFADPSSNLVLLEDVSISRPFRLVRPMLKHPVLWFQEYLWLEHSLPKCVETIMLSSIGFGLKLAAFDLVLVHGKPNEDQHNVLETRNEYRISVCAYKEEALGKL